MIRKTYVGMLMMCLLVGCQSVVPRSTESLEVKQMRINGADFAYIEEGKGVTVVVIHGAVGDWRTYEGVRPWISSKYHYVSYSRRYHYPNAWTDDGSKYNFDQHIEDLAEFIRSLNAGKVHIIGNSYAGRLAGVFALKYPELLRSAVLGDSSLAPPTSAEGKAAVEAIRQDMAKAGTAAKAGDSEQAAILVWDAVNRPHTFDKGSPGLQKRWLDNAKTVRPMFAGTPAKPVSCEQLAAIRVPVMVLGGDLSREGYLLGNEALLRCLPTGTQSIRIPNAHHKWNEENPDATA